MKNLLYDLSVPAHAAGLENSDASERRFDRRLDIGLLCLVAAEWLLLALLVGLMPDVSSGSALRGSLQLAITGFAGALLVGASALSVCGVRPAFEPNRVLTLSQVAACSWFLVLNGAGDLCWVAVLLSLVTVSLYRDWRLSATAAAALSAAILVVRGQQPRGHRFLVWQSLPPDSPCWGVAAGGRQNNWLRPARRCNRCALSVRVKWRTRRAIWNRRLRRRGATAMLEPNSLRTWDTTCGLP